MSPKEQQTLTAEVNKKIIEKMQEATSSNRVAKHVDLLNAQTNAQEEMKRQSDRAQASRKHPAESNTTGTIQQNFQKFEVDGTGNMIGVKIGKGRQVHANLVNDFTESKTLSSSNYNVIGLDFSDN
jgi:hypothetical protein